MIASLILLGTWPALFNLLERRGRVCLPLEAFAQTLKYSIGMAIG